MDLATFVTACALGFRAELFIPLGALDNCSASLSVGTAAALRDSSPGRPLGDIYHRGGAAVRSSGSMGARTVMQAESRGVAGATSAAGAIGLMQIMPETYAELRVRYGLGANAYDPHDNIIAGTAYMSEMIELFGIPNFLAAYNAGPARLEDHLRRGRPLPRETQRYLAEIGELSAVLPWSGEIPAVHSVAVVSPPSNAPSSNPQTNTSNASMLRMASAPAGDGQHRRPNNIRSQRRASSLCRAGAIHLRHPRSRPSSEETLMSALEARCSFRSGAIQCGSRLIPLPVTRSNRG